MSGLTHSPARGASMLGALGRAERGLLVLGAAALLVAAVLVLVRPSIFDLPALTDGDVLGRFLAASAVYVLSHLVRVLRLVVLLRNPALRLRRVLQVHLMTAGLGVLLPFKLGDLVRIREVGVAAGSWRTGLLAVWLERALDAAVLAVLVLITAVGVSESLSLLTPFLIVLTVFVVATAAAIAILPENIRALMLHIVRRPFGERSVPVLRALRGTLDTLHEAPGLLRGRVLTLLLLSVMIWGLEIAVVSIAVPGVTEGVSELSTAMLSLLSGVSSGAPPISPASSDRLVEALTEFGTAPDVGAYRLVLLLPMLLAGAAAAITYLPWRLRR